MLLATALLIIGLLLVVYSADRLVFSASILCRLLGVPPLIIGMTVVSVGTSLPEIIVSAAASMHDQVDLAVGTAIGSNIVNILLILGLAALLHPFRVHSDVLRRELPLMLIVSLLAGYVLYDGQLTLSDGIFLLALAVIGAAIGAVSLSGSVIAWAKLDGRLDRRVIFPGQQAFNLLVALAMVVLGVWAAISLQPPVIIGFFVAALALGVLMTLPIGGADMPVVISLYNAFTGLAVAFEGYVLGNEALIIAGTMVGAAGMLLTRLMAKAMNRSIRSVLFSSFGASGEARAIEGAQVAIEAGDVAAMMAYAERVVIVPGYGMAVAQAQHKIWELAQRLMERGVKVKFAIHPVAGRMPGHMNVLLAEAGVPYDLIADMDDINPEFATTDVSLVIGANDVVNPVAKTDPASPIYGMPILDVVDSRHTIVIKRGAGTGFAGIENALFYAPNTRMLYGDGAAMAGALVSELKALDGGH